MPRMKTPKGYYTISEAAKVLDLSSAMVRRYVEKGRIQYLLPEGRSHGFYLKKDVDNLAIDLNAYLSIEDDDNEGTIFSMATKSDLPEIVQMGRAIFSPDSERNLEPPEWQLKALEKNPEISFILRKEGKLVGYINTVPFTADNPKAQKCLTVEFLSDVGITPNDIETYDAGKHIHLYIMAVCTSPELKRSDRKTYGSRLINSFVSKLIEFGTRGVIIDKITARGDTRSGVRLLQAFGFNEMEPPAPGKRAFIIDLENSHSHFSKRYREALTEWTRQNEGKEDYSLA
jgi:excisionase family DNA binding protein